MNEATAVVNVVFAVLMRVDLLLFHIVNGWCGNWVLDYAAWFAQDNDLFKGGIVMAAYWWFWFIPGSRDEHRRKIVAAMLGALLALIVARALASGLPLRVRPLYAMGIGYRPPSLPQSHAISGLNLEDWSSFPSDHAALFFALAYGLLRLSRPVGVVAMLGAAIWIGLDRIYLGIHYPSDVIVGGAVGIVCAYFTKRVGIDRVSGPILTFAQDYPQVFYAAMFLFTFEISVLFDDIRRLMRGSLLVIHAVGFRSAGLISGLAAGVGIAVLVGLLLSSPMWLRRRRMK